MSNEPYSTPSSSEPVSEPVNEAPQEDWRTEHRERHAGAPWAGGLILIVIGAILLLRNLDINIPYLKNWWALFILIPAAGSFGNAWSAYRYAGALDSRARGALLGGFFMTILAGALLFGINWAFFWPVMLILGGIAVLVNNLLK